MNLPAYFIFFFPTSQKIPCWNPSTIEYNVCALKSKNTKIAQEDGLKILSPKILKLPKNIG